MRIALLHLSHPPPGSHPRHPLPPLDLGVSAALLGRQGHTVLFADSAVDGGPRAALRALVRHAPDWLAIRPAMHALADLGPVVDAAARAGIATVAAGPVATTMPEALARLAPALTGVAVGEPEALLSTLAETWDGRGPLPALPWLARTDNGWRAREAALVPDVDALPAARHALFLGRRYPFGYPLRGTGGRRVAHLLASRGCPHACSFCSPVERASLGRRYRPRDPARVAEDVREVARLGATGIYFQDDLIAPGPARAHALADAIARVGAPLPWACQVRVGSLDIGAARALAQAGCSTVCVGIESGDPAVLARLDKGITVDETRAQVAALRQAGLLVVAFVIVGAPGETPASLAMTRALVRELAPDLLQVHVFARYPGAREGDARRERDGDAYGTKFEGEPADATRRQARADQAALYRDFYLSPSTWARAGLRSGAHYLVTAPDTLRLVAGLLTRLR